MRTRATSEVGEATGIFLVFSRDGEDRRLEFTVAELLEGDRGGDGGEDRDVWGGRRRERFD